MTNYKLFPLTGYKCENDNYSLPEFLKENFDTENQEEVIFTEHPEDRVKYMRVYPKNANVSKLRIIEEVSCVDDCCIKYDLENDPYIIELFENGNFGKNLESQHIEDVINNIKNNMLRIAGGYWFEGNNIDKFYGYVVEEAAKQSSHYREVKDDDEDDEN